MDHVCKSALTKELQEKSNGSVLESVTHDNGIAGQQRGVKRLMFPAHFCSCPAAGGVGGARRQAEPDPAADPSLRDGHDLCLCGGKALGALAFWQNEPRRGAATCFLTAACSRCIVLQGTLAQAVKKGHWILLDEINLAAAETLECLSGLLEGSAGSLVLLDRGDTGEDGRRRRHVGVGIRFRHVFRTLLTQRALTLSVGSVGKDPHRC